MPQFKQYQMGIVCLPKHRQQKTFFKVGATKSYFAAKITPGY
jgi:hypothetical protein